MHLFPVKMNILKYFRFNESMEIVYGSFNIKLKSHL